MRLLSGAAMLLTGCAAAFHEPAVRGFPRDDPGAALSIAWIGHSTALLRFGHRYVLTDPNLSGSIFVQPRVTPPSVKAEELPRVQLVVLSHLHVDHFDVPTLRKLPTSTEVIFPPGAAAYMGQIRQTKKESLPFWRSVEHGGIRVTAVPVMHAGGRYFVDAFWNHSFAGYVIEAAGRTVFFAGDTGYDKVAFRELHRRFPSIDVALIPIAPAKGGNANHANPEEAVRIFEETGARYMVPIHFEAYASMAVPYDVPRRELFDAVQRHQLSGRVFALYTGERLIVPDDGAEPKISREK